MYNSFTKRHIKSAAYVTIIFLISAFSTAQNKSSQEQKFKLARQLVPQLGANSYKKRKAAIKSLIELGYFARNEVKKVLNSEDPEMRENARTVWEKIRFAITEKNPELVNAFIKKFKANQANLADWVSLVEKCRADSVSVMMEISNVDDIEKQIVNRKNINENPFGDEGFVDEENGPFSVDVLLPVIVNHIPVEELKKVTGQFSKEEKNKFSKIAKLTIVYSAPYTQSRILAITSGSFELAKNWELFKECDITSRYLLTKIPQNILNYAFKNLNHFNSESYSRALILLTHHNKFSKEQLSKLLKPDFFHQSNAITQKIFYNRLEPLLRADDKQKLLKEGNEPWQKYKLLTLQGPVDHKKLGEVFTSVFENNGDIIEFIEENFTLEDTNAIPFYLIDSNLQNSDDSWFLYSGSSILTRHFHRIGDFKSALRFLKLFNDENERLKDSNANFFIEQQRIIKKETVEILKQVQPLIHNKPQEALKLLDKALLLNPEILIIKVQKIEALIKANKKDKARELLKETAEKVPNNLIELRDLIHLSWELQDKEIAELLTSKLILDEEDYGNFIVASSNYEFFLDMDKTQKLQESLGGSEFAQTRKYFYEKKFDRIPPICLQPDEGDYQFLWGVAAVRIKENKDKAFSYLSKRVFDEHWPEMLALCIAGKISTDEIIDEANSCLNLIERKGRLTEAYYFAACALLAENKNDEAKQLLQKTVDLGFYEYYEYVSARVLLETFFK